MPQGEMYEVDTARVRLNVRDSGDAGETVVLLHGWPESSYCWEFVVPQLSGTLRLVRPDLRGLGDSERTDDVAAYRKKELAQDVLALLDEMGIATFGLVGHDWGGWVAQEIAIAAPARVSRLCIMNIPLIGNAAGYHSADAVHAAHQHKAYWYQHFMQTPGLAEAMIPGNEQTWLGVFLRGKEKSWVFPPSAMEEYVRCYRIPGTSTTGANYYRSMRIDVQDFKARLNHRFPMPSLLLFGIHDPVVIPEFLDGYEQRFEKVTLRKVESSHFLQEENPEAVAAALKIFFA